ncbi:DUF6113 family protein [Streptantibioticus rubrisoli]|uniref:DUF6113 family protein n=1 Tax=Streptantibioticus rubrisoli TaxID=1387313 RepID=UPI002108F6F4|nr:DUF6113 family protein [Streptantibioticus rubrisoli]
MNAAVRIVQYVVLGILGVLVAAAGAVVQDGWFPGGLILALAGCAGLFYGGAQLTRNRLGAAVPTVLWFLTVMYLSVTRPEGDFLFAAGLGPYIYLLGGMAVGVICGTLPRQTPPGAQSARLGTR